MILLLSYDVTRRGGIERLTLQVRDALLKQGLTVKVLCPRARGPGQLGRWLGRLGFLLALGLWAPRCHPRDGSAGSMASRSGGTPCLGCGTTCAVATG
jgi:hypothetical protein